MSEPIPEYHGVDAWKFQGEIRAQYRPAVLRGLVADWPAVARGNESNEAMTAYLAGFDSGRKVLAGMLLILPGILSDVMALALLALRFNLGRGFAPSAAAGDFRRSSKAIDGEYRRLD